MRKILLLSLTLLFISQPYAKEYVVEITDKRPNPTPQINLIVGDTLKFENTRNEPVELYIYTAPIGNYILSEILVINPGNTYERTYPVPTRFYYSDTRQEVTGPLLGTTVGSVYVYEKPVIISPGNSTLLGKLENKVSVIYYSEPFVCGDCEHFVPPPDALVKHIALILDKKTVFDGTLEDLLKSPLISDSGVYYSSSNHYFTVTIPPNSLSKGQHTIKVRSNDSDILYDEVRYTIR